MTDKEKFINYCKENIRRDGIDELLAWLDSSDFYTAPASTKFHGNYLGGLCEHSLNVYETLRDLCDKFAKDVYSDESIAISALFHDFCKINFYEQKIKNVKDENDAWVKKPVWVINEKFPCGDHADKSIIIVQQYMKLLPDEIMAIRAHMGGYDSTVKGGSYMINNIFDRCKLAVLMHAADFLSSNILEIKI